MTLARREDIPCDLCGGADLEEILKARPGDAPGDLAQVFTASAHAPLTDRLVRCRRCGLVFVSPRLTAAAIADAYGRSHDSVYPDRGAGRMRTFEHLLRLLEPYTRRPGAVFDVGTATGEFLAVARRRGWRVDGCEPNRRLLDLARDRHGLDIRHGTLATIGAVAADFDLVTLWDVLEHMPSPTATLSRVSAMLRPGGIVAATFPDIGSLSSRLLRRRWPLLSAVHLYYFSRETARALFSKCGFDVITIGAHRPRVELGHALQRASATGGPVVRALSAAAAAARLDRAVLPFQFGQSMIVARLIN